MNVTLVCEDNIEGIMTAIYDGWVYMNKGYSVNIHPGSDYAPTFFSKFINIETDNSKAERVRLFQHVSTLTSILSSSDDYQSDLLPSS